MNIGLGVQKDWVSNYKYHSGPGWSTSNIKTLRQKSIGHMIYHKEHPTPPTDAMAVGQAFHTLALEPEHFTRRFHLFEGEKRSNAKKKEWSDAEAAGKIIIRDGKLYDVAEMVKVVKKHKSAGALLTRLPGTTFERAVYWEDPETGLLCKCRPDIHTTVGRLIISDMKKCEDASKSGFRRACGNYFYDVQAGMYLEGCARANGLIDPKEPYTPEELVALLSGLGDFAFICCEDTAPYGVAVYKADDEMIFEGLTIFHWAMPVIAEALKKKDFPLYPEDVQDINLPAWRLS